MDENKMTQTGERLLTVDNLKTTFMIHKTKVEAVRGASIHVDDGDILAVVGESGSGKSVLMKSIMGLLPENAQTTADSLVYMGRNLLEFSADERRKMRGKEFAMIFQDPMACLNPRQKVADIIAQGLDIHHRYHSQKERTEMVADILHKVGLAPEHANRYPHQFSGGQRQRVGIARALVMNPKLIIADECISALDMSIQAQVVNLMKDIQDETGLAYLFIAHDLSMVKYISDRIGVLHLGYLLETGTTEEIFSHPVHPYTRSLISAIPNPNPVVERSRIALHYDYKTSGLDYGAGTMHQIEGTHFVRGTDADLEKWV